MSEVPNTLPFNLEKAGKDEVITGGDTWDSDIILPGTQPRLFSLRRENSEVASNPSGSSAKPSWRIVPETGARILINREPVGPEKQIVSNGDCILSEFGTWTLQYWDGLLESVPEGMLDGFSVRVRNLSVELPAGKKKRKETILKDIDFEVESGSFVGILGPSGSGKSSLIQRLAQLARWSKDGCIELGKVVDGNRISIKKNQPIIDPEIAYVPQDAHEALHENLSVWQELGCHLRIRRAASETDESRKSGVLAVLGLSGKRDEQVGNLSGGQQRRLAIALALLQRPKLLLLDEPTSGLDPDAEAQLMSCLEKLSKQGCTVICSTHMLANLDQFTGILVLDAHGRQQVIDTSSPDHLTSPDHLKEYVKKNHGGNLIGFYNKLSKREEHLPVKKEEALDFAALLKDICSKIRKEIRIRRLVVRQKAICSIIWNEVRIPTLVARLKRLRAKIRNAARAWLDAKPESTNPASPFRSFSGYLLREWFELSPRSATWLFVALPVLLSTTIRFGLRTKFDGLATNYTVVTFCACLAVFWLGMSHAVRLLVGERIPGRCLERLDGVGLLCYLSSKMVWCGVIAGAQTAVFLLPFLYWKTHPSVSGPCWEPHGFFFHLFVLAAVHWMGGAVGLAVSAVSRLETTALTWVPLLGMIALLFSAPVLEFMPADAEKTNASAAELIARHAMPCNPAERLLDSQYEEFEVDWKYRRLVLSEQATTPPRPIGSEDWRTFARRFVLYLAIAFAATAVFQRYNESKWEGR